MTTGCNCGTAGCPGVAYEPGARCPRCEIAAMPPGPARTLRQIVHAALNGPEIRRSVLAAARQAELEAGS
jgi:hypothetical protein